MVWTFALFWYQIYTNYDVTYAFDYSYILLFNLAFTSLPVILMGVLDQDVDDKVSLAVPQLYRRGIERKEWTQRKFWMYMADGLYQSIITFFFTYLVFQPANFNTISGRTVNDYKRMGVYIGNPAVVTVNIYFLLNTYRWDWFMVLITSISFLLIFFWTGVYTAFTAGFTFYHAAPEVYGSASFWANMFLTIILCLLPRFTIKAFQKIYMPRDVDIVREQIRQGKFDYLKAVDADNISPAPEKLLPDSASSSETSKPMHQARQESVAEDMRPIYPPSVAATATTHNPRSHNGSDGTEYTQHRDSIDRAFGAPVGGKTEHTNPNASMTPVTPTITTEEAAERPSFHRPRPSFDRLRSSMDRTRASFEVSRDFTSAAYLQRVESRHSAQEGQSPVTPGGAGSKMKLDITDDLRR